MPQTKKRIGLLVPEYRTDVAPGGGVSTVADFVYEALAADAALEVDIVSPRMASSAPENHRLLAPSTWFRGPRTSTRMNSSKRVTYVGSYIAEIEALRYLPRKALTEELNQFDAIIVVCGTPAIINSLREIDTPIVAQVATTITKERQKLLNTGSLLRRSYARIATKITYALDKRAAPIPTATLTENPWMQEWCIANGAQNVKIEIPGIDTNFFTPRSSNTQATKENFIVSIGRLGDPRKDFGTLVRAYAHAKNNLDLKQKLVIAGRGKLPTDVSDTIQRLNLQEDVEVLSDVSADELRDLYRDADLFAMSSSEEGLGMVLLEALACGTPIVTTATEGAKSVVNTAKTGTLIALGPDLERRLAEGISKIANDNPMRNRMSRIARERATELFSLEKTNENFRRAITDVMKNDANK